MTYDSTQDTIDHIRKVQARLEVVIHELRLRGEQHDASKLEEPEKSGFDVLTPKLRNLVYGSPEYDITLIEARPTIAHHYKYNSHHPEHWPNGIRDMSLLDVIEMLCDWKAASARTKQGSIAANLAHNRMRFQIDDQLAAILENTVRDLGW